MKLLYGLAGIAILVSALPPVSANAQGSSGILISEINWAGSETSQADEWIELINVTDTAQDISGWLLVGAATSGDAIALPDATILEAHQTLLIANYKNGDLKSTLGTEPNLVTTALSLANSSLHVFLTDPHGLVHDSYEDTGTPDFGSTSPITSIERNLATSAWQNSVTTLGLIVQTQFGTPGTALIKIETQLPSVITEELSSETIDTQVTSETSFVNTENTIESEPDNASVDVIEPETEESIQNDGYVANISEESTDLLPEIDNEELVVSEDTKELVNTDGVQNNITQSEEVEPIQTVTNSTQEAESLLLPKRTVKSSEVKINEILSSPSSGDEWVEIYNTTDETFPVDGWTLTDASGKTTTLSGNLVGYGLYLIKNPAGKLNNDGDDLTLKNEHADVIDTLVYGTDNLPAPGKDQSLAYTINGWLVGEPTPEKINPEPATEKSTEHLSSTPEPIYAQEINTDAPQMDTHSGSSQLEEPERTTTPDATDGIRRIIAIAQPLSEQAEDIVEEKESSTSRKKVTDSVANIVAKDVIHKKHGEKVSITGTVIMEPMKVAKQVMYLEGLEIYFHAADWPKMPVGSSVKLTGTVDHESTNTRIKLASSEDVVLQESIHDIVPTTVVLTDLATLGSGRLVSITGNLALLTKTGFTLQTDTGNVAVNLKAASDVATSKLTTGTITVTGVLIKNKAGAYEVYPRSSEDLKQDTATKTVPSTSASSGSIAPTNNEFPTTTAGLSLGAVALGIASYWFLKTKPELLTSLTSHLETYVR